MDVVFPIASTGYFIYLEDYSHIRNWKCQKEERNRRQSNAIKIQQYKLRDQSCKK